MFKIGIFGYIISFKFIYFIHQSEECIITKLKSHVKTFIVAILLKRIVGNNNVWCAQNYLLIL